MTSFRGEYPYPQTLFYEVWLSPITHLKRAWHNLYDRLLRLVWPKLFDEVPSHGSANLGLAGLGFLGLGCLSAFLGSGRIVLVALLVGLWWLDRLLAQHQLELNRTVWTVKTVLETTEGREWQWQSATPEGKNRQERFFPSEISQVSIALIPLRSGAFQELIAQFWQVQINYGQRGELPLFSEFEPAIALRRAEQLAAQLKRPVKFAASEGANPYAIDRLDPAILLSQKAQLSTLLIKQMEYKWEITSGWDFANFQALAGQMLQRSGFPCFALLGLGIATLLGQVTLKLTQGLLSGGLGETLWRSLIPLPGWVDMFLGILAICALLYGGTQIVQEKRINFGQNSLTVTLKNGSVVGFKINQIKAVLFVRSPIPRLLILDEQQSAEILDFQVKQEFRVLLAKLEQGIEHFRPRKKPHAGEG